MGHQELGDLLFLILEAIKLYFTNHHVIKPFLNSDSEEEEEEDTHIGGTGSGRTPSAHPAMRATLLAWFRQFAFPHREREAHTLRQYQDAVADFLGVLFTSTRHRNERFDRLLVRTLNWIAGSPQATETQQLGARILAPFMVPRDSRPSLQALIGGASASSARALLFALLRHNGAESLPSVKEAEGDGPRLEMALGWGRVLDVAFHARCRRVVHAVTAFDGKAELSSIPRPTDYQRRVFVAAAEQREKRRTAAPPVSLAVPRPVPTAQHVAALGPSAVAGAVAPGFDSDEEEEYSFSEDEADSDGADADGDDGVPSEGALIQQDNTGTTNPQDGGGPPDQAEAVEGSPPDSSADVADVVRVEEIRWSDFAGMTRRSDARAAVAKLLGVKTPAFSLLEHGEALLHEVMRYVRTTQRGTTTVLTLVVCVGVWVHTGSAKRCCACQTWRLVLQLMHPWQPVYSRSLTPTTSSTAKARERLVAVQRASTTRACLRACHNRRSVRRTACAIR